METLKNTLFAYNRVLKDGSIVIEDASGQFYHVEEGKEKVCIEREDSVDSLAERVCKRLEMEDEEKRQKVLDDYQKAVPCRIGSKWGLKVGNRMTVPPIYRNVKQPIGRYCAVEMNYSQWGLISIDGTVLIEPRYPDINIEENGTVVLTSVTGKKETLKV